MTPEGLSFALQRMNDCPNVASLKRVWQSLGREYQGHPLIKERKERLKVELPND